MRTWCVRVRVRVSVFWLRCQSYKPATQRGSLAHILWRATPDLRKSERGEEEERRLVLRTGRIRDAPEEKSLEETAGLLTAVPMLEEELEVAIKVVVVGNGAVGKSSMIQRYCKGVFTRDYKKTIGVDFLERQLQ